MSKRKRKSDDDMAKAEAANEAKAEAAKLLRWKTDMETAMRDSATLEELHDSFLATAPASLQAKVLGCGQVSLGRMDQLLKPFVVIRSNRKLMRKFYKINGVSFGRQSSWPEMGIESNGCTSLVNGMIELLALMHKFNHVHILVNTESKESNTTWKAKREALIELDRDFEIRSAIEEAEVHSDIKVIAIDILNQINEKDVLNQAEEARIEAPRVAEEARIEALRVAEEAEHRAFVDYATREAADPGAHGKHIATSL